MPDDRVLADLAHWNTPTIYNGWEAMTSAERTSLRCNREPVVDYLPEAGSIVGYAVTLVIEPTNPRWPRELPDAPEAYRAYVAAGPGPKVVVVQDLDRVTLGSFWGEVNSNVHRALGCVGAITDGAIRDLDEVRAMGFKHLARRLCVGHAYAHPVRWGVPVEVFGVEVRPGDLIHADQHGFLVIPEEDVAGLAEATAFLDGAERETVIGVAAGHRGTPEEALPKLGDARRRFKEMVARRCGGRGEP